MKRIKPGVQTSIKETKVKLADVDKVVAEVNAAIAGRPIVYGLVKKNVDIDEEVYVSEGTYYLKVCGRWLKQGLPATKPHCLVLPIADREVAPEYTPISAAKMMRHHVKDWKTLVDNLDQIYYLSSKADLTTYAVPGVTYEHCWGYDINKCYLWVLKTFRMPDTRTIYTDVVPGDNQIGFLVSGRGYNKEWDEWRYYIEPVLGPSKENIICDYVFDLIESPFKDFAEHMISEIDKATEKSKSENIKVREAALDKKKKYKYLVNVSVGLLQDVNPFLRAAVVGYANLNLRKLTAGDPSVLLYNTDSIISTRPRTDLDIGEGVGQWKLEHEDESITFLGKAGFDYEWETGKTAHRGVATNVNKKYCFNKTTRKIEYIGD